MKKVLLTLLLVCMVLPTAAYADPPGPNAVGSFVYTVTSSTERLAGDNLFVVGTDTAIYEGTFAGESTEEFVVVGHGSGFVFYKGTVSFTGKVFAGTANEREGTLEILFVGKSPGSFAEFTGTWRIISGGGDLADLHGQGTWWNTDFFMVDYEGRINFAP